MSLERTIFSNLVNNTEYGSKVFAFLTPEYFHDHTERTVFNTISEYVNTYNAFPSKEALLIEVSNRTDLNDDQYGDCKDIVNQIPKTVDPLTSLEWLIDSTEKFCQDKAIYNAILESMKIIDDKDGNISKGAIPQLLSDALAVSFNADIGLDFLESAEARYEYYHRKEEKIPFDLEYFNKITKGGLSRKEMHIIIAPTGIGKSMVMCHMAAANLALGSNVLYITLEMSQERIAERIDQNMLNISNDDLKDMPKDMFIKRVAKLGEKTTGKLIVKEYPTASAGSANFRHLLNELKNKKGFVPDVIYVDYLNICSSSKLRGNNQANSYTIVKSIAEELRGLAVEFNLAMVSATQTNREGMYNTEIDLTNTSESIGITHTAGLIIALISTPQLEELNQLMVIQLKNRYNDVNYYRKFIVGIDRSKMKLYNVEQAAQRDISGSGDHPAVFDQSTSGKLAAPPNQLTYGGGKFDKSKFEEFK